VTDYQAKKQIQRV